MSSLWPLSGGTPDDKSDNERCHIMKNTQHIVFTGGGTAGHLFPGLAVARKLAAGRPGVRITFAGAGKPLERELVDAAGFDYLPLSSRPLPRRAREALSFVVENMAGYFAAGRFLDEEQVAGVVGLGGYASVPLGRAAARRRLPLVLLEQNAVLGRANRWLSRFAGLLCTSFPETERLGRRAMYGPLHRQPDSRRRRADLRFRPQTKRHRPGRQRRGALAKRKRAAGTVQDSTSADRLADRASVGRGRRGIDAGAVSQVRPGGPGRGLLARHAGADRRQQSGDLPRRRDDAGGTVVGRHAGLAFALSQRRGRSSAKERERLRRRRGRGNARRTRSNRPTGRPPGRSAGPAIDRRYSTRRPFSRHAPACPSARGGTRWLRSYGRS